MSNTSTTRHYIYALIDPRNDEPFYVGQTKSIGRRLSRHLDISEPKTENSERVQLIKEIMGSGQIPLICELDRIETSDNRYVDNLERQWINHLQSDLGHALTNVKDNYQKTYGYHGTGYYQHITTIHEFKDKPYDDYEVYARTPR